MNRPDTEDTTYEHSWIICDVDGCREIYTYEPSDRATALLWRRAHRARVHGITETESAPRE